VVGALVLVGAADLAAGGLAFVGAFVDESLVFTAAFEACWVALTETVAFAALVGAVAGGRSGLGAPEDPTGAALADEWADGELGAGAGSAGAVAALAVPDRANATAPVASTAPAAVPTVRASTSRTARSRLRAVTTSQEISLSVVRLIRPSG
jgi:hypothetical protein